MEYLVNTDRKFGDGTERFTKELNADQGLQGTLRLDGMHISIAWMI
jgi:hypothetical protein